MKRVVLCFFFLMGGISAYSQVKTVLLDDKDKLTADSSLAITYAVFGKLENDSVYTFKKFDFTGVLLTSGSFKDDSLLVPHGKFVYYNWITPQNNYTNDGYEINGKERFIEVTGSYKNGARTGRWISFYPDGRIKQVITFSNGVIHGAYQAYNPDGKLQMQGLYVGGKKNGTWTLDSGKQENEYVNDELISSLRGKKLRDKQAQRQKAN